MDESSEKPTTLEALGAAEGKQAKAPSVTAAKPVELDDLNKRIRELAAHRTPEEIIQKAGAELGTTQITCNELVLLWERLDPTKQNDSTKEVMRGVWETAAYLEAHRRAAARGMDPAASIGGFVINEYGFNKAKPPLNWDNLENRVLDRFMRMDVVQRAVRPLWELTFDPTVSELDKDKARREILRDLLVTSPTLRAEMAKETERIADEVAEKIAEVPEDLLRKQTDLDAKKLLVEKAEKRFKGNFVNLGVDSTKTQELTKLWEGVRDNLGDADVAARALLRGLEKVIGVDSGDIQLYEEFIRKSQRLRELQDLQARKASMTNVQIIDLNDLTNDLKDSKYYSSEVLEYRRIVKAVIGEVDAKGNRVGGLQAEIESLKTAQEEKGILEAEVKALQAKRDFETLGDRLKYARELEQAASKAVIETLTKANANATELNGRKMRAAEEKAKKDQKDNLALGLRMVRTKMDGDYVRYGPDGKRIPGNPDVIREDIINLARDGEEGRKRIILRYLSKAGGPIAQVIDPSSGNERAVTANDWKDYPLEKLAKNQQELINEIDTQVGDLILKRILGDYASMTEEKIPTGFLGLGKMRGEMPEVDPEVLVRFYEQFKGSFPGLEAIAKDPEVQKVLKDKKLLVNLKTSALLAALLMAFGVGAAALVSGTSGK